ncbi:MAG: methyltransferase domain-containing protein [Burkholderiaceae bacterium]|nr:methyltransferase domain-containing protein [Burkholderiaceae bacterium]
MGRSPSLRHGARPAALALLLGLAAMGAAHAQTAERYQTVPSSADGIGKAYHGREIARMMGFDGAAWLERTERQKEERADLLIAELALKPGMDVADVGAGTGYYSRRVALQVGPQGKVYAIEVQPQMLHVLETTAKRPGYGNIVPVLGAEDDVKLPDASIDLAIMVDVYHELASPHEVLASIVRAVRPGGRVVFVEYRGEDSSIPIKPLHKMTEPQIRLEAADHALVWERTARKLPWQHVVVFSRP